MGGPAAFDCDGKRDHIGDARYVDVSGDTMTGTLVLNPSSGLALNARGTISGALITQNGAGDNYFMGNLGVGTATPSSKVTVEDSATDIISVRGTAADRARLVIDAGTAGADSMVSFLSESASKWSVGVRTSNSYALQFAPSFRLNSPVMTLTTGGNLGLGTTTPTAALHINRNAGDQFFITNPGTGGETWRIISTANSWGAGGGKLGIGISEDSTAQVLYLTSEGNVGIGKTSPSTKLDVVGTISGSLITQNGAGSNYFRGNLGIGTATPSVKLHAVDTTTGGSAARPVLRIENSDAAYGAGPSIVFNNNWNQTLSNWRLAEIGAIPVNGGSGGNGGALVFYTHADTGAAEASVSERMRINHDGNVGIGTTAPLAKLHVLGSGTDNVITSSDTIQDAVIWVQTPLEPQIPRTSAFNQIQPKQLIWEVHSD